MIQYDGFEAKHPSPKKGIVPPLQRKIWPYYFHIEDYFGDEIYYTFFPESSSFKKYVGILVLTTVFIIIMRVTSALV